MSSPTIVYWYPAPIAVPRGYPVGRQWSLMHALSQHVNVVILSEADSSSTQMERVSDRLFLLNGAFAETRRARKPIRAAATFLDRQRIASALRSIGVHDFVMWLSWADKRYLARSWRDRRLVYDCIDPSLSGGSPAHDGSESTVCQLAGQVFATAGALLERVEPWSRVAALLPNGCTDLGSLAHSSTRRRPVAGFLGTIDQRVAVERLHDAASRLPGVDFVLGGRVNSDRVDDVGKLSALANVRILGPVAEDQGQALIESFDVGLVPFSEDDIGDAINPVKMFAYLERGLPVVATDIRECRDVFGVAAAGDGAQFAAAVDDAVSDCARTSREARRSFALENTWGVRADAALEILRSQDMVGS